MATPVEYHLEFRGRAAEFFNIWIVNLALSIVTLGIYSAWAKVRTRRYFYGCTLLDGASFDYTADPVNILKGRIIAGLFFGLFTAATHFAGVSLWVVAGLVLLSIAMFFLYPWVIVRSMKFNARYTEYRNVHFSSSARYIDAVIYYMLAPIAVLISGFLAYPVIAQLQKKFYLDNMRYGGTRFDFKGTVGDFYKIYGISWAISIGAGIVVAALVGIIALVLYLIHHASGDTLFSGDKLGATLTMIAVGGIYAGIILVSQCVQFGVRGAVMKLMLDKSVLGDISFRSNLKPLRYVIIGVTNILAVVASLGMAYPWAKVRMTRYLVESITVTAEQGSLQQFAAESEQNYSSLADQAGDFFDIEIGF